jgi:hypothetical protein
MRRVVEINGQQLVMEIAMRNDCWQMAIRRKHVHRGRVRWRKLADVVADAFFLDLITQPQLPGVADGG